MRIIINTSGLLVALALLMGIHTAIINVNIREQEVHTTLESAVDYAIDKMQDVYHLLNYDETRADEYIQQLANEFNDAINEIIGTDGELFVTLIKVDLKDGVFHVVVEENYNYGFLGRTGTARCERNMKFS